MFYRWFCSFEGKWGQKVNHKQTKYGQKAERRRRLPIELLSSWKYSASDKSVLALHRHYDSVVITGHGLYGSTSCCISQWPNQWEMPVPRNPSTDFDETWICSYFPGVTTHANTSGAATTWVVWENSQFATVAFISVSFCFFITCTGRRLPLADFEIFFAQWYAFLDLVDVAP